MADDDSYTVTTSWSAVEANGADITNGTFTVFSLGNKRVDFIKAASVPTDATVPDGVAYFDEPKESIKYTLGATEELYARSPDGNVVIGVIPA